MFYTKLIVTEGRDIMTKESLQNIDIYQFQKQLISWYEQNKRDLPWRKDQDPYKVWVSEVMLQQTRVDTVIPYFERFMKLYPTIYDLAQADEQEVLKMWEGLGYYSRARNLHEAVQEVVEKYDGIVPSDGKKLEKLKGIGPYTKGAILSIAFHKAVAAVDGNVMRVLSRILLIFENITEYRTRTLFEKYANQLISKRNPGAFNQGLMELGALICKPRNPLCHKCPVRSFCKAYEEDMQEKLPVRDKAKAVKTIPYVSLLIKNQEEKYLIEQRPETGLLANMWQFPMIPIAEIGYEHISRLVRAEYGINIKMLSKETKIKHIFSHLIWEIEVFTAKTTDSFEESERVKFVSKQQLSSYPFPVPHLRMKKLLGKTRE